MRIPPHLSRPSGMILVIPPMRQANSWENKLLQKSAANTLFTKQENNSQNANSKNQSYDDVRIQAQSVTSATDTEAKQAY